MVSIPHRKAKTNGGPASVDVNEIVSIPHRKAKTQQPAEIVHPLFYVSIPHRKAKTEKETDFIDVVVWRFQFLIGRLKPDREYVKMVKNYWFQFLIGRLKPFSVECLFEYDIRFNSS